jgi:hypothetical protein
MNLGRNHTVKRRRSRALVALFCGAFLALAAILWSLGPEGSLTLTLRPARLPSGKAPFSHCEVELVNGTRSQVEIICNSDPSEHLDFVVVTKQGAEVCKYSYGARFSLNSEKSRRSLRSGERMSLFIPPLIDDHCGRLAPGEYELFCSFRHGAHIVRSNAVPIEITDN